VKIPAIILSTLGWIFVCCTSCSKGPSTDPVIPPTSSHIIKGADISWLTEMEASGKQFYTTSGVQQDCIAILKGLGMNAIRLRAWVNPSGGWNNKQDLLAKAIRAKNAGMKIMIDLHYSDTWADPGHQDKPASWQSLSFDNLKSSLYAYTVDILTTLKDNAISPDWVQVGNETNDGMLWPDGKASVNMNNFAQLINSGYDAVKAVFPSSKVIVHISNGYDNNLFRWIFDGLKNNGAKWDIIGMSLYPSIGNWQLFNTECLSNMNDMVARYNKELMVVEVGMSWDQASTCNSFLADLVSKVSSVNGGKGLGIFYWEPESYGNWKGYTLGAFDNSGKPTIALNAFN
jgi:arabinogalactan endo-1,4-beta-galactosidase